ncbi:MAG: hypothetical protein M3Q39_01630 [Actinomycetota bacterium]|nr:hypothetical protein [Actinomycetota bacterium]
MLFTILIIAALILSFLSLIGVPSRVNLLAAAVVCISFALLLSKYGASLV